MLKVRVPTISVKATVPLAFMAVIFMIYFLGYEMKYIFAGMVVLTYAFLFPQKLMNPKNLVFAYYFVWYCLGPIFANRYQDIYERFGTDRVNTALVLCFVTYAFAMFTLEWFLGNKDIGCGYCANMKEDGCEKKISTVKYRFYLDLK